MRALKLIVAVVALTLFAQIECAAACTSDLCSTDFGKTESVPPCHQHHHQGPSRSPDGCSFHVIVSSATSPAAPLFSSPVLVAFSSTPTISAILPANAPRFLSDIGDVSPPGIKSLSSTLLRI